MTPPPVLGASFQEAVVEFWVAFIIHFSFALAHTPLAHLSFWKGALLEVEAKVVATHLAVRSLASSVRLLAFMDPMPHLVT
jgi:hypothetical protein